MNVQAALLIIDVQIGMFVRKNYDWKVIYNEGILLDNISSLIKKAKATNTPIFYMQHTVSNDPYMGEGKQLWEIHPLIKPEVDDIVIIKYHPDSFLDTDLHDRLQSLNVRKLFITGIQTEFCVDTTCRRAFSLGYHTTLVSDAHSTYDSEILSADLIVRHHNQTLANMFVELRNTSKIELF